MIPYNIHNELRRYGHRLLQFEDDQEYEFCVSLANTPKLKAMEADTSNINIEDLGINVNGTPMRIGLMTDKVIERENLKQITNSIMFRKGNIPTSDSLFSYEIFGTTSEERRKIYAYINLGKKFFHPYIYEVLRNLLQVVDKVVTAQEMWKIVDGEIKLVGKDEEPDPSYGTGLRWIIDNYHNLKFTKNKSYIHNEYVDLLTNSSDDEIFRSKWQVIPVFYRDANFTGKSRDIPEVNDHYKRLIQLVNALQSSVMTEFMSNTELNIQNTLVTIRKYGQSLVEGKRGFLKQFVIGKTTGYGARNVITQPAYTGMELPNEVMVDMFHSGFPIATCCSLGYPFIERWITDFFAKEFETKEKKQTLVRKNDGTYELIYSKLGDVLAMYNPDYIEKKTEQFMETYGSRFEPLTIPMADGSEAYILFTGRPYSKDPRNPDAPETARRPMTWTDLLYLACVNTLEFGGKMAYVTRYPMVDYFGTFPSMIRVSSTVAMEPMEISGTRYPFYPKVVIGAPQDKVSTMFCDTLAIDNTHLAPLGGDYDGDMVSESMCFSDEANDEAYAIMTDIKNFVSISGNLVRHIGNEATLTFYCMTQ